MTLRNALLPTLDKVKICNNPSDNIVLIQWKKPNPKTGVRSVKAPSRMESDWKKIGRLIWIQVILGLPCTMLLLCLLTDGSAALNSQTEELEIEGPAWYQRVILFVTSLEYELVSAILFSQIIGSVKGQGNNETDDFLGYFYVLLNVVGTTFSLALAIQYERLSRSNGPLLRLQSRTFGCLLGLTIAMVPLVQIGSRPRGSRP